MWKFCRRTSLYSQVWRQKCHLFIIIMILIMFNNIDKKLIITSYNIWELCMSNMSHAFLNWWIEDNSLNILPVHIFYLCKKIMRLNCYKIWIWCISWFYRFVQKFSRLSCLFYWLCFCRQPDSDECVFEFRWKSTVACHIERYRTVKAFRDLFEINDSDLNY